MQKILFFPGMGEKPRDYTDLSKYMTIVNIDWNTDKYTPKIVKGDILVGFSLGCYYPLTYALRSKVKMLILCSLTPLETLKKVKADKIIFMVGSKEKFVLENSRRLAKELKMESQIVIVPNSGHKITGQYKKKLLELLKIM